MEKDADGFFRGPDDCAYETEWEAQSMGVLGMCGCGRTEEAYNFLRHILQICDRRGDKPWVNIEPVIGALVTGDPELTAHVLLHFLTDKDVIEHGGSVGGSWLTRSGEDIVDGAAAPDDAED